MSIPCLATLNGPPPDYGTKSKFLRMVLKVLPHLASTCFSNLICWHSLIQTLYPSQTKLFTILKICLTCLHHLHTGWSLSYNFFSDSFFKTLFEWHLPKASGGCFLFFFGASYVLYKSLLLNSLPYFVIMS